MKRNERSMSKKDNGSAHKIKDDGSSSREKYTEEEKTKVFKNSENDTISRGNNEEHFNNGKVNDYMGSSGAKENHSHDYDNETDLTKNEKHGNSSKEGSNLITDIGSKNNGVSKKENSYAYNPNFEASSSNKTYYSLSDDKESNSYNLNKKDDGSSSDKDLVNDVAKDEKCSTTACSKDETLNVKENNNDIINNSLIKNNGAHSRDDKDSEDDLTYNEYSSDDVESMKELSSTVSDLNLFLDDVIDQVEESSDDLTTEPALLSSKIRLDTMRSYADFPRTSFDFDVKPCNSCEFPSPVEEEEDICCGLCKKREKRYLEFWIISVPKDDDTWANLNAVTQRKKLSQNYKFHLPTLKVGVLNDLMSLTEQLLTLDNYVKDVVETIYENKPKARSSKDCTNEKFTIYDLEAETYLTRFTWNNSKYSSKQPVRSISDVIFSKVQTNENILKKKVCLYEEFKANLRKYERREQEPLQSRFLGDIVKKEHFVLHSNYLITLLVVVPKDKVKLWWKSYEKICDKVVPKSSNKIFDDGSHCLFNVTIYRKNVEEFKSNARKMKFIVREFQFSERKLATEREYIKHLSRMERKHRGSLCRFASVSFVECFEAWIHVKALRVFVESVVRYGFPVNFQAMLIQPRKSRAKLKKVLLRLYSKADVSLASGSLPDIPGNLAIFNVQEYYPYFFLKIDLNFLYKKKNL